MSFMDRFKKAGKQVVDAGAKTMLKSEIMFLDRDIKTRKQEFGIEIYDLMADLESNETMTTEEKETKIRQSFDAARKDIAVIQAKKECKKEEMAVLDSQNGETGETTDIPPSSGTVLTNTHPQDAEMEQM
mmetsp:Transcript_14754/g.41778  ORF Transcript_14754/g.41778 Transcript_14754/m.41778 type:complete len:130 (+) Transcript_14754:98-487(+)|eukprot:CAMPEP_0119546274 /NCGR_PEP_ID=MMETSP1352-20130426/767_1 /TAXON_ID=265584 /ORGANISM="Stauroneis constricta, Strain CCMP1120" /LENGTH=129 /DNA_ID=CAMNT_0007590963 /DNA_START=82 /DNA_END=471 /DNA_ORIENTATION=+